MIMLGNCIRKLSHFSQLQLIKIAQWVSFYCFRYHIRHKKKSKLYVSGNDDEERPHKYLLPV